MQVQVKYIFYSILAEKYIWSQLPNGYQNKISRENEIGMRRPKWAQICPRNWIFRAITDLHEKLDCSARCMYCEHSTNYSTSFWQFCDGSFQPANQM